MTSTRNPCTLYYKKYDFPQSLLHYWNDTRWKGNHSQFHVDDFSQEEAGFLSELINGLPTKAGRHFRMRYLEKLSYQAIADRNEESYDTARMHEATAIRILFDKIDKNRDKFPSLHRQYDYLYRYNFSYGLPAVIEKCGVQKYTEYNGNPEYTVISEISGLMQTIKSDILEKCINHIIWLPEDNLEHATSIFKEYLEKEISEMERKLPVYKAQLLLANKYLS